MNIRDFIPEKFYCDQKYKEKIATKPLLKHHLFNKLVKQINKIPSNMKHVSVTKLDEDLELIRNRVDLFTATKYEQECKKYHIDTLCGKEIVDMLDDLYFNQTLVDAHILKALQTFINVLLMRKDSEFTKSIMTKTFDVYSCVLQICKEKGLDKQILEYQMRLRDLKDLYNYIELISH